MKKFDISYREHSSLVLEHFIESYKNKSVKKKLVLFKEK